MVLRCHGEEQVLCKMATYGNQQRCNWSTAELQPLAFVSLTEQTTKKSAHSPNKNWKFITSGTPVLVSQLGHNNVLSGVFQRRWRVRHETVRTWNEEGSNWSLWNEWIITVCAGGDQQSLSPLLWNNCVWYDLPSPIKKGSVFRKTRLLCSVLSPPMIELF